MNALWAALFALIVFSMLRTAKIRFETRVFFVCALPLFVLSFSSQRYIVHAHPLLIVWIALHVTDLFGPDSRWRRPGFVVLDRLPRIPRARTRRAWCRRWP